MTKKAAEAPVAPSGITPDEVLLLRRRQEWRARMLRIFLNVFTRSTASDLSGFGLSDQQPELRRFLALTAEIHRDMQRLLESELVISKLELHRHGANYFLDTLILTLRHRMEQRPRSEGRSGTDGPLESLSVGELEEEVVRALQLSPDALPVFLNQLVQIEQFELEVQRQRRRLQFLLGCDRALRDLAESNSDIIDAPYDQFCDIVQQYFALCRSIGAELAPMLEVPSPYEGLQRELENSRGQLDWLKENVFEPMEELRDQVEWLDEQLIGMKDILTRLASRADSVRRLRFGELEADESEPPALRHVMELKTRLLSLKAELQAVNATPLREMCRRERSDLAAGKQELAERLAPLEERLISTETELVDPAVQLLRRIEEREAEPEWGGLRRMVSELAVSLESLERDHLQVVQQAIDEMADRNLTVLKERICQELGFVRTTFLQPSFAHIAAEDPRSDQTAQYFYLKEFADEADRSQQLLEAAHSLWQELEGAQATRIRGLRFTANNLKKIADRVLLERRTVPAGPGWRELASFLQDLKDRLVPKLRMICQLPGVRFDDRDQLSLYASEISESCGMLLAQRETAHRLMREVDDLENREGGDGIQGLYEDVILKVTCDDMARKLRGISKTLLELIPFVGAMVGSIRMRTSLSFHRERDRRRPLPPPGSSSEPASEASAPPPGP